MTEPTPTDCVACLKPIPAESTICPHCQTDQTRPAKTIAWVSGALALVSLVLGVIALNVAVQDWREKRAAIEQLTAGAEKAMASNDFGTAQHDYRQAAELDRTSAALQEGQTRLALRWLRTSAVNPQEGETYREMADSLMPHLYQGLEGKPAKAQADLWAHIGWAHHLRQLARETLQMRPHVIRHIEGLYDRAFVLDPHNVYAHAFAGCLALDANEDTEHAANLFASALNRAQGGSDPKLYVWVRSIQLMCTLKPMTPGFHGRLPAFEKGIPRGLLLLRALDAMRAQGEGWPDPAIIDQILGFHRSRVDHADFDGVFAGLPADAHLATFEWVLASAAGQRWLEAGAHNQARLQLVHASLLERAGRRADALQLYQALATEDGYGDRLDKRIDEGLSRMTGTQPPRMVKRLGRTYLNDPLPETGDVHTFHLDTLKYFDPVWQGENVTQAIAYFLSAIDQPRKEGTASPDDMLALRKRVSDRFRRFRSDVATGGYTLVNSVVAEITLTNNVLALHRLVATQAQVEGRYDHALAELADAESLAQEQWIPSWIFELRARAYSKRGDQTAAARQLRRYVTAKAAYGGALSEWQHIKTHPDLAKVRATAAGKTLLRGR